MKIILFSMPDVAPVIMHESAFHMPNLGIASLAANIDPGHEIALIDLIRKRRRVGRYLRRVLRRSKPDLVGLSSMTWQYATCVKIIKLIRRIIPDVRIVIGGYHATLMYAEIAASEEARDIDFIIRGEGEVAFKRLLRALDGRDQLSAIPSLSYKHDGAFVHNPKGDLLNLEDLKLPVRDRRRLTWGYHIMNRHVEVMETSRGCTRRCNFCSIRHMYGRAFRAFPIERILADIDDIYLKRKVRWIFVADDNMVLDPRRVMDLCDAIIRRGYRDLYFTVQADCVTMARNPQMVARMAQAGFRSIFLGMENVSPRNLQMAQKGDIVNYSRQAVKLCQQNGIMVIGGMIFGFPDDREEEIIANYQFLKTTGADTTYCQILTPYPKTGIRQYLMDEGLVTNPDDFTRYNGMWANVRTRHLSADRLQYLHWYHRLKVLGWWEPSEIIRRQGRLWTSIWIYFFRPMMKVIVARSLRKYGWQGRFEREMQRQAGVNRFDDLKKV
jgi:radical SAM superfamily enzyme YgiQ (UPF0313 family)